MSNRRRDNTVHDDDSFSSNSSNSSHKSLTSLIFKTEMIALEGRNPTILQIRSESSETDHIESDTSRMENNSIHECIIGTDSSNDQSSEEDYHSIMSYLLTELCVHVDDESNLKDSWILSTQSCTIQLVIIRLLFNRRPYM